MHYKNLLVLALFALLAVACEEDDDEPKINEPGFSHPIMGTYSGEEVNELIYLGQVTRIDTTFYDSLVIDSVLYTDTTIIESRIVNLYDTTTLTNIGEVPLTMHSDFRYSFAALLLGSSPTYSAGMYTIRDFDVILNTNYKEEPDTLTYYFNADTLFATIKINNDLYDGYYFRID